MVDVQQMMPPHGGRQRGFTLMEVLVALVVFAISVVGLVALESRAIDSQRASANLREAERIAQKELASLQSYGFLGLVSRNFEGDENPAFPYDDAGVDPGDRLRDYRRPPADIANDERVVGEIRGQYIVYRRVDWIQSSVLPPTSNPPLEEEWPRVTGLEVEVTVLWVDDTNPSFPPPADLRSIDLVPAMTVAGDPQFSPYVGQVRLRTVRVNDAVLAAP